MDIVTRTVVELIEGTDVRDRQDILDMARLAFIDYIASLGPAEHEPAVQDLARFIQSSSQILPWDRALYYGFASHYLDFDDAQANLAGHFSTVLYSALLAVLKEDDTWYDFLRAYSIGAEVEGIIGSAVNPQHRSRGWHSTGTVGVIGAAAAIGALRGVRGRDLASLLSLSATQSCGMGFQSGSDGKPLHAGLAARNAVWTYELLSATSLRGGEEPFRSEKGWFNTIAEVEVNPELFTSLWFQPGQIIAPGLWMKVHPYCSAAICGAEAASRIGAQGIGWDDIEGVTVHFPPEADAALRYSMPKTGREGQFSIEYVLFQIFAYGRIVPDAFKKDYIDADIQHRMRLIRRVYDMEPVSQTERITKVTVRLKNGREISATVNHPKGAPENPLTLEDIKEKLALTVKKERIDHLLHAFEAPRVYESIESLKGEGVLHV